MAIVRKAMQNCISLYKKKKNYEARQAAMETTSSKMSMKHAETR